MPPLKIYIHRGEEPALYYWRTVAGSEVDLVVETQGQLIPIEVKQSETVRIEMGKEIITFQKDFKEKSSQGYVIHTGEMALPLGNRVVSLPFADL